MLNCGATVRDKLAVVLCCGLAESFTVIATVAVPEAVGVPLMTPAVLIDNPLGKPVADQLKGPVPPLDASVALYAEFTTPFAIEAVVIVNGEAITSGRLTVTLWGGVPES